MVLRQIPGQDPDFLFIFEIKIKILEAFSVQSWHQFQHKLRIVRTLDIIRLGYFLDGPIGWTGHNE
jgi:hypothetical protein